MHAPALRILYVQSVDAGVVPMRRLNTPSEAAGELRLRLQDEAVEVFAVLCLTVKNDLAGYHEVSRGSLTASIVHPREVFKAAILLNAATVIVAHNHPSGDPAPSPEDLALTRRLHDAGQLLGVDLLDHIVIGAHGQYFSFREAGRL